MSIKVMTACWERYPNGGGELLLALALADHADDDGENIYPGVESLSRKTRQSKRTIQYQLRKMEDIGWLQLVAHEGGGRGRARQYRVNPDWLKGADIAPIGKNPKGANAAPFNGDKGANTAPFNDGKRAQELHPSGSERVQPETQRVQPTTQKGATAIAPESSGTVKEPSVRKPKLDFSSWPALPDQQIMDDWIAMRKRLKAAASQTAINRMGTKLKQCLAAGYSVNLCLSEACLGNWKGLELEWLTNKGIRPDLQRGGSAKPVPPQNQEQIRNLSGKLQDIHSEIKTLERLGQQVPDELMARQASLRQQLSNLRGGS
jgi:hypothetical protein